MNERSRADVLTSYGATSLLATSLLPTSLLPTSLLATSLLRVLFALGTVGLGVARVSAQDTSAEAAPSGAAAEAPASDAAAAPTDDGTTASPESGAVDPGMAEAMERFADAQALFERGDHRGALAEMQRVYELLEGTEMQHIVLYNLGRVYEELHRYDLAVDTFHSYLARSPADAPDRADAEASLRTLERLLGTIAVTVDVPRAEVWIGEWQVGEAPGEIRVPSGVHELELRAAGYETVRRQIEVTARSRVELTITMAALAAEYRGLDPALFVTSTVLAVVGVAIGAVLGGMTLSMSNDAASCGTRVGCTLDVTSRRREIADLALGADVLFGTAGLFAVTSIILAFVTDWGAAPVVSVGEARASTAFRLAPLAGPDGAGASLHVSF